MVTIAAAVSLVGLSLAGCSGSSGNDGNSSSPQASQPPASSAAASGDHASPSASASPDISEHVKLTWVMLGDPPKDFDAVKQEFNKKTNADLNADVDFVWIGWGDLDSKYPLMLTSGQNADLIYTAAWLDYTSKAKLGAFTTLTQDMLDTYAPDAVKKLPPEAWKNATVDGNIIAVPRNFLEYQDSGIAYRGDILAKSGLTSITSIADVAKYLEAAKAAEPNIIPYNTGSNVGDFPLTQFINNSNTLINVPGLPNLFLFDPLESKPQISSPFDNPLLLDAYPEIRDMFQKGYINKNVLNNKVQSRESFKNGQSALATYGDNQFRDEYNDINTAHPDWKIAFQPFSPDGPFLKQSYDSGMMSIPSASKNKERALMLMNKFFADSSYYMLLIYGIEGKHWEYTADQSMIEVPEGTDPTLYPKWQFPWGFGDWVGFNKPSVTDYPDYAAHIQEMRDKAVDNPYINFKPNTDSIANQIAALNNVYTKYAGALSYGAIDPETSLPKIKKELEAAGYSKVKAEIQKQLDAYTPEP
jgi:putative aldouronate transport system substrate-binding protein